MGTKEFENKIIMATSEKHWTNQDFQDTKKILLGRVLADIWKQGVQIEVS